MTKNEVLEQIRRLAEANEGVPLGRQRFEAETGIRECDWRGKLWARWSDAVCEAGFAPNELTTAYDEDELLGKYADLAVQLGCLPTDADMRLWNAKGGQFPSGNSFTKRFGGKAKMIERLLAYCRLRGEYSDVARFCEEYVRRMHHEDTTPQGPPEEIGFVYLMKSGRFYKIGRSNAAGRRHYELGIQLPEKLTQVHQIRTDDPAGLEAYWHKRFESKRQNGEWFALNQADVAAFRRRKFM